jgi:hypothetical protein
MKKTALISIIGAAALCSAAIAQTIAIPYVQSISPTDLFQDIPLGNYAVGNKYVNALQLQAWLFGGNSARTGATAPALTSCGSTGAAISGNDYAGTVTVGGSASTSCIVTFNTAYIAAPTCVVTSRSQITSFAYTVSTTAITVTQTSTASNLFDYVCVAKAGG